VLVDGAHEWSRQVPTDAGGRDSLDVRFRRTVPVGQPLRLTAIAEVDGALPLGCRSARRRLRHARSFPRRNPLSP
jgi:hypothetical protein